MDSTCGWQTKGCPLSSHRLLAGLRGAYPLLGAHAMGLPAPGLKHPGRGPVLLSPPGPRSPLGWYLSERSAELIEPQPVSLAPQTLRSLSLGPAETGHHHCCPSSRAPQEDIPEPVGSGIRASDSKSKDTWRSQGWCKTGERWP